MAPITLSSSTLGNDESLWRYSATLMKSSEFMNN